MKKKNLFLVLILAILMSLTLTTLSGCGKNKGLDWSVTDENAVVSLDLAMQGDDANRMLVLSYGEGIFDEKISDKQIKVYGYDLPSDESTNKKESDNKNELTGWSVRRDSAKQLTVMLPAGEAGAHWGYAVAVHPSGTTVKKYGEGWAFRTTNETIENVFAEIEGAYNTAQANPIIAVVLNDTSVKTNISKDMVTLGGAFSALTIKSVSGSNNRLTIVTEGKADKASGISGSVTLSESATECGKVLEASADVAYVGACVDESTYKFENETLSFNVALSGDVFAVKAGDKLITTPLEFTVKAVSEDKKTVTVSAPVTASGLDEAIGKVSGGIVTIPADKIKSGSEQELAVVATKASVGMDVGFVEKTDDATVFKATATLFVANGKFSEFVANGKFSEIYKPELTFSGDFADAVVKQIERDDAVYRVTFTFSPCSLDLENAFYEGSVSVQSGMLLNVWGTSSDNNSAGINYIGVANRGETIDAIKAFVAAHKDTLDTISTVGSVVSGVAGAASGVMTILQICGVVESTDDKLDSIRRQVEDVQASVSALSNQLAGQTKLINSMVGTAISQNTKILYNTAAGNWNSFIANYLKPLTDALTQYKSEYNLYMLGYINDPTQVEIPVYINTNGAVTISGNIDGYDAGGVALTSSDKYVLNAPLENVKQKVLSNGGRLYEGYAEDIAAALNPSTAEVDIHPVTGTTEITAEQYVNALRLAAAMAALNKVGAEKIATAYVNFATALAGTYGAVKLNSTSSPLTFFYDMESYFYNFYSESEYDIKVVRNWMASVLVQGHAIAVLAHTYCTGLESDYVSNATTVANNEWKSNTGAIKVKPGKQYSYVAGDELFTTVVGTNIWEDYNTMAFGKYRKWGCNFHTSEKNGLSVVFIYNPKSSLSISQIEQMKDRYENIRKKGAASDATFADYLVSKGIISADQKDAWLIGDSASSTIPKDNSVLITVRWDGGDWYDNGDSMRVGTNGKLSSKYFEYAYQLKGTAFKLSESKSDSVTFASAARYDEDHWYWINWERYKLYDQTPNTLMYIEIG